MISEIEAAVSTLTWRLTRWVITLVIRIFWLPLLVIGIVYYVAIPALAAVAQLLQALIQPAAAIAVLLLVLWMWRR